MSNQHMPRGVAALGVALVLAGCGPNATGATATAAVSATATASPTPVATPTPTDTPTATAAPAATAGVPPTPATGPGLTVATAQAVADILYPAPPADTTTLCQHGNSSDGIPNYDACPMSSRLRARIYALYRGMKNGPGYDVLCFCQMGSLSRKIAIGFKADGSSATVHLSFDGKHRLDLVVIAQGGKAVADDILVFDCSSHPGAPGVSIYQTACWGPG